jgi:20S proteasome subunit beta 4
METLFGITGKDFVITAYDSKAVASITLMKTGEDKSRDLNSHALMLFSGEPGDGVHFSEYIERNVKLYGIRNGIELSPKAVASFARRELADSLRSRVGIILLSCSLPVCSLLRQSGSEANAEATFHFTLFSETIRS